MNKTITAHIGGYAFTIEEDAFAALQNYLRSIENYYKNQESGEEIIADIETRIAELFKERLGTTREVIVISDVEHIVSVMGKPEQYEEETADSDDSQSYAGEEQTRSQHRRFYRDPDDYIIGGVASGISHYLSWDPLWIRIAFILLTLLGAAGIPIYIILWAVIPQAKTTAEKLRMKGENINVENISKAINENVEKVKSSFRNVGEKNGPKVSKGLDSFLSGLGKFAGVLASIIRWVFGAAFLILGTLLVVGLTVTLVAGGSFLTHGFPISFDFVREFIFVNEHMFTISIIAALLLTVVPIIALLYGGVRLLLRIKMAVRGFGLTLVTLFIIGIGLAIVAGVNQAAHYREHEEIETTLTIQDSLSDTLYVVVNDDPYFHNQWKLDHTDFPELIKKDGDKIVYGFPEVYFRVHEQDQTDVELYREASGNGMQEALDNAESIEYGYTFTGDTLFLDPFFKSPAKSKFRGHEMEIVVRCPEGHTLILPENMRRMTNRWSAFRDYNSRHIDGHTFQIVDGSYTCITCPED